MLNRLKLWFLGLFIDDIAGTLRAISKLVDRLDAFAERKLAEADSAQASIEDYRRKEKEARDRAVEALRVRDKIKENLL